MDYVSAENGELEFDGTHGGVSTSNVPTAVPRMQGTVWPATAKTPRIVETCATPVRSQLPSPIIRSPRYTPPEGGSREREPLSPRLPRSPPVRGAPPTAPSALPGDSATDEGGPSSPDPESDDGEESSLELPMPLTPSATALISPPNGGSSSSGMIGGAPLARVTTSPGSLGTSQNQKSATKLARMGFGTPLAVTTPRSVSAASTGGPGTMGGPTTPREKTKFSGLRGFVAGLKGKT